MSQRARLILDHFIEELCFARRATPQAQPQDLERDDPAASGKRQHIADSHRRAGLFDTVSVQPNLSLNRFLLCQAAGLAEARMPEPFVDAKRFAQSQSAVMSPASPAKGEFALTDCARDR